MKNITMEIVITGQNKRRRGEFYPESQTLDEIDYLIVRVRALENELSVVHTDRLLEKYKEFEKTPEGKKAFFDDGEQDV